MSIGSVTCLLIAVVYLQNAALSSAKSDKLYFSSGSQLLVITRDPSTDETVACIVLKKGSTEYNIKIKEVSTFLVDASKEFMTDLVRKCNEFNYYGLEGIKELARKRQILIYPGTKWCGVGDNAKDVNDLGEYSETDKCCRAHDKCDIYINAFQTKYDLFNLALYSVQSCDCNEQFRDCLVSAEEDATTAVNDKSTAKSVGNIFFNVVEPKCLQQVYPVVCIEKGFWGRCTEYKDDTTKSKVWAFRDNYLRYPSP
ncbi:hypothetical protein CHS0354_004625 [Potamilus streckersoni]|uniref:Phospholipase A2-like central domain-containing protein n=1 Tax=Potamilus streckersoni TaxID=2493646 RepID=A0AAE0S565_9BIVA|nr:hypothetical protein CHS0354_004625 [Potamilus streckersoni]